MSSSKKTDNANLPAKLELRRYFLRKYHQGKPPRVLECCQGAGRIWKTLSAEFEGLRIWGLDVKRRKGRLAIDSARLLAGGGWSADVVDVDTYGMPWTHWLALLDTAPPAAPLTVFLTIGLVRMGGGGHPGAAAFDLLGLKFQRLSLPGSLCGRLCDLAMAYALHHGGAAGLQIVEIMEAANAGNARYLGIRLTPAA